ncbi:MAG: T9SS type A sorting domain-containing protein [Candidatus Latescibacteria bacterium]|nr:T9SS type A sorting domain-containing protein [Candidatus Latescibacterota bacterium]
MSANQLVQSAGEDAAVTRTDADYSATIWQGWDDEALYYIAEVRDNARDVVGGERLESWWERDSMTLYVDLNDEDTGGDCCSSYTNLNIINFVAAPQNSSPVTITLEKTVNHAREATIQSADIAGFEYAFRDAGDEFGGEADYVIEGKIPWAALVREGNLLSAPGVGSEMGFSWLPIDPDGDDAYGGQLQCVSWATSAAEYADWRFADPIHVVTAPPFPIHELTDADTAAIGLRDGSIAEWEDILGAPSLTAADFTADPFVGEGAPYNPADLDYRIWLGWHPGSGRLYMAMERVDDVYINTYPGGNLGDLWRYDSIEFMVDGDHSGGDYTGAADSSWTPDEQTLNNNRTAQQYLAIADAPDGQHLGYTGWAGSVSDWVINPPFADGGGGSTGTNPTTSAIEFYVTPFDNLIWNSPGDSKASDLFSGKIIGFQISVPDFDTAPEEYHAFHTLAGQPATWRYADRFVDGRLLSDKTSTPPPSELPPPRLQVVIPNGGQSWSARPVNNIYWFADASLPRVSIEYSVDNGDNWQTITPSTVNDGVYEWAVPPDTTETALVRIADAADGDPVDISDAVFSFAIPHSFPPEITSFFQKRVAIFPGEPLDLYAQTNGTGETASVYVEIRKDTLVAVVSLADNGISPDQTAGDGMYSGQWSGADQVGFYSWKVFSESFSGARDSSWTAGLQIAHTIVSIPAIALLSPEALASARVPLLIEDDGNGYLSLGFLAASFDIYHWKGSAETPSPVDLDGISFAGTELADDTLLVQASEEVDEGNTEIMHVALASANLLRVSAGPGPAQEIMAYINVNWDSTYQIQGSEMNVSSVLFDEDNLGVAPSCCGFLEVGRGDVDTSRVIDSFDASLVLMDVVGHVDLSWPDSPLNTPVEGQYGFQVPAVAAYMAEVSGQLGITALDAALIMRREVGIISHFPAEEGYYRVWDPPEEWWNPPTPAPVAKPVAVASSLAPMRKVVSLGAVEERDGGALAVPVVIDQMEGVLAGSFSLRYDPRTLQPAGVRTGALTRDYLLADRAEGGVVRVAFAGSAWQAGSGALAEVLFQQLGVGGEVGVLALGEVQLNEGDVEVQVVGSGGEVLGLPQQTTLYANYPNPFNPSTALRYELSRGGVVRLGVYNLVGQRVRELVSGRQQAGRYVVEWDGRDEGGRPVGSGVYLCQLQTEEGTLVRKMLLVK